MNNVQLTMEIQRVMIWVLWVLALGNAWAQAYLFGESTIYTTEPQRPG